MPNYKFTSPEYVPSNGDLRTFLEVLEYLRHKNMAGMLESDPASFPDEEAVVDFVLDVGDHMIADMESDMTEAVETDEAAVATMHAISTGLAFAALAHSFPVVRDWL